MSLSCKIVIKDDIASKEPVFHYGYIVLGGKVAWTSMVLNVHWI